MMQRPASPCSCLCLCADPTPLDRTLLRHSCFSLLPLINSLITSLMAETNSPPAKTPIKVPMA